MSVFSDLAEATIAKAVAEHNLRLIRQQAEQALIDAAGSGVKAFGPNITDQERAFTVLLLDDQDVLLADAELAGAEAAYERAKARVREYECEAGRRCYSMGNEIAQLAQVYATCLLDAATDAHGQLTNMEIVSLANKSFALCLEMARKADI